MTRKNRERKSFSRYKAKIHFPLIVFSLIFFQNREALHTAHLGRWNKLVALGW
jgi:hypothetical protein